MSNQHQTKARKWLTGVMTATCLAALLSQPVHAEEEEAAGFDDFGGDDLFSFDEFVVTAQKRAQSSQEVPISIQIFQPERFDEVAADDLFDLEFMSGSITFGRGRGAGARRGELGIRGVYDNTLAVGNETRVAQYVDGVFLGRGFAYSQEVGDIERVEVLRGPQGTLFGRNAVIGGVSVITRGPGDELEVDVEGELGNFDLWSVRAFVGGPITSTLKGSFFVSGRQRDGVIEILTDPTGNQTITVPTQDGIQEANEIDRFTGRAKLVWEPTDKWRFELAADVLNEDQALSGSLPVPGPLTDPIPEFDPFRIPNDIVANEQRELFGIALTAEYEFLSDYTVKSISAYRNGRVDFELDGDRAQTTPFTPLVNRNNIYNEEYDQFTQEFQVISPGNKNYDWVAGLYYFHQDLTGFQRFLFGIDNPDGLTRLNEISGELEINSVAPYVNANYRVLDWLELTAGLRYTYEDRQLNNLNNSVGDFVVTDFSDSRSDGELSPKGGLNFYITDSVFAYVQVGRGFKGGGFYTRTLINQESFDAQEFESETSTNYEAGVKMQLFDKRLTLNVVGYRTEISDFQIFRRVRETAEDGTRLNIDRQVNAEEAVSQGLEIDFVAKPLDILTLRGSMAYTDAFFSDFVDEDGTNFTGNELPFAPDLRAFVHAELRLPVNERFQAYINGGYSYVGDQFQTLDNNPFGFTESYDLVTAQIGLESKDKRWRGTFWVRNALDDVIVRSVTDSGSILTPTGIFEDGVELSQQGLIEDPRTFGFRLTWRF